MKKTQKIALALSVIIFVLSACLDSKNNVLVPATNVENTTSTTQAGGVTPTITVTTGITSGVSFVNNIMPILTKECLACHQAPVNSGGINLETYIQIKKYVDNGKLYGSISGAKGFSKMPPGGTLVSADIANVKAWIDAGAINDTPTVTGGTTSTTGGTTGGTTGTISGTTSTTTGDGTTTITVDCPTGSARMLTNARTNDGPEGENKNTGTTITSTATVCFDKEVLPFFQLTCAFSGCHNSQSKKEGYDLSNYASIVSKGVKAGNPNSSEIYSSMTKTGKDRMPPAPYPAVSKDKLDMIAKWIQEGAQNKICGTTGGTTSGGGTTSVVVNFATVNSIIQANCVSCHQTGFASAGVNLDSYSNIKHYGTNGRLYGSISGAAGYKKMPPSGQLTTCDIAIIKKWIDVGMPNN